ncbi:hypothetical protein [Endozoicomonas sp. 4G]|uniref:hypothetical protein n=1 Tax=Endozoicomonas sp. 4G TaxID=2872754 RepID=UPI0020785265|nr:hypothetical protein [Endozoicomonas sp. 4G]
MKRLIRLVAVLIVMSLPRIGYSGDNRYDSLLPLTASLLSQMFRSFIEEKFPEHFLSLEKLQVWSLNRDHRTSDAEPDEQTVDGVMVVTAGFRTTMLNSAMLNTADSASQLQPSNFVTQGIINAYFSSVLPLLTEYFRAHFNPDKNYYLDRANINRNQLPAVADDPDDSDGSCDNYSRDQGEASEKDTGVVASVGATATHQKCESYECSGKDCAPVPEPPEFWKAHLVSEGEQDFIVYEATLYYSGFLKPACTAEPREEPSPEQSDSDEEPSEEDILVAQTRECIDLFDGGFDRGLSKHLKP